MTSPFSLRATGQIFYQKPTIPMKEFLPVIPAILLAVLLQVFIILTLNIVMMKFGDVLYGLFNNKIATHLVQFSFIFFLIAMLEKGIKVILEPVDNKISEIFSKYMDKLRLINYYNSQSASRLRKDTHSINKTKFYFLRLVQHIVRLIILLLALPILIVIFLLYLEYNEKIVTPGTNDEKQKPFKIMEGLRSLEFSKHKYFLIFIACAVLFYMLLGVAVAFINNSKSAPSPVLENYHLKPYRLGDIPERNIVTNEGKFTNIFIVNNLKKIALAFGLLAYGLITSLDEKWFGDSISGEKFIQEYSNALWLFLVHGACVICIESTKGAIFAQLFRRRTIPNQHPQNTLQICEWGPYRKFSSKNQGGFLPLKFHSAFKDCFRDFTSEGTIPERVIIIKILRNDMTIIDYFKTVTRKDLSEGEILSYLNQTNARQLLENTHLCPLTTKLNNSAIRKEIFNNIALSLSFAVDPDFDLILFGISPEPQQLCRLREMRQEYNSEVLVIGEEEA
jgi:hypothetical protein